jgi:hypothetical protein
VSGHFFDAATVLANATKTSHGHTAFAGDLNFTAVYRLNDVWAYTLRQETGGGTNLGPGLSRPLYRRRPHGAALPGWSPDWD